MTTSIPRGSEPGPVSLVTRIRQRIDQIDARLMAGLTARRPMETAPAEASLVEGSWLAAGLGFAASTLADAWRSSVAGRTADGFLEMELHARVQAIGFALLAAVATHTVVMAMIGVQVHALGWSARAVLALIGAIAAFRSGPVAAAWRDRRTAGDGR